MLQIICSKLNKTSVRGLIFIDKFRIGFLALYYISKKIARYGAIFLALFWKERSGWWSDFGGGKNLFNRGSNWQKRFK